VCYVGDLSLHDALPIYATSPTAPRKYTAEVWMATQRASNPMIDGVMIRLLVTVWKLTVATAWHSATTIMTMTVVPRSPAIRQKPEEPTGIGLSQARI